MTLSKLRASAAILISTGWVGAGFGVAYAAPPIMGDLTLGKSIAEQRCAGCHGMDGNATATAEFPKLGGQHFDYLAREIADYCEDKRPSEIMRPVVAGMSEAEVKAVSAWYASQSAMTAAASQPELLALGKKVYFEGNAKSGVPSCDGCHEEDGAGSKKFPRVAGQNPAYTIDAFQRYAKGQRPFGKKVMRTVAERMTEKEIQAVAEFMATLK